MDTRLLVVNVLVALVMPCYGHVGLYFPPARTYALDFLDSARTKWPCGMARGRGPVTDLEAGSTFVVSWYLGYAHQGGYRLELMQYDGSGNVNTTYGLVNVNIGTVVDTTTSHNVTLPANVTSCTNCTIRLVRHALEWGRSYVFWSCSDVNIVPLATPSGILDEWCLGHGTYNTTSRTCRCDHTYSGSRCQFKDECEVDADCGSKGKCIRVTDFSYPQKQCFCQPGYFGLKCDKVSQVKSTTFDSSLYVKRTLSPETEARLYYRIVATATGRELEVVVQAKTNSFIGFGWKPRSGTCIKYSQQVGGSKPATAAPENEPEPEAEPTKSTTPAPEGEAEAEPTKSTTPAPEGEAEAEPTKSTTLAPEAEAEAEPTKSTTPVPEGEAEAEPTKSTTPAPEGEAEAEPNRSTTLAPESEPENEPTDSTTPAPEPEQDDGIGDGNKMDCADIVIGAAVDEWSRVRDYYTSDRSTPRQDEFYGGSQSLTAAVASQSADGTTTVIFRRPINATEDTDHTIRNELMTAIWAHGQVHPEIENFYPPDEIKYHGLGRDKRGHIAVNFFESAEIPDDTPATNRYSSPKGCSGSDCNYLAEWNVNKISNVISFTISAKQPSDHWTGIAFAREKKMENMDVYIGYMDNKQKGVTFDGFTSQPYAKPSRDATQNMMESSVTYQNGMLQLSFQRAMDTGDDSDWKFSNTDCYYFFFPVGGGSHTGTDFSRHANTPVISENKICIDGDEETTVTLTREEYDALKEELFAYKVATIVLAVVTAIALICVIILIRYCIVRLRTASDYALQK